MKPTPFLPSATRHHGGKGIKPLAPAGRTIIDGILPVPPPAGDSSKPVKCHRLEAFASANLDEVSQAFQPACQLTFQQPWLEKAEPGFAPGLVRLGWRAETLLVFAELSDADIFTNAVHDHDRLWEVGDCIEIFLRPAGQTAYMEFQIAPNNQRLQLHYPDPAVLKRIRQTDSFESARVPRPAFDSRTWVLPATRRWFVFAEIPAASVCETHRPLAGSRWHFSFGRYDYARGRPLPVISSTSGHPQPDFHRQAEWSLLQFFT